MKNYSLEPTEENAWKLLQKIPYEGMNMCFNLFDC